jgi:hypothetical protein
MKQQETFYELVVSATGGMEKQPWYYNSRVIALNEIARLLKAFMEREIESSKERVPDDEFKNRVDSFFKPWIESTTLDATAISKDFGKYGMDCRRDRSFLDQYFEFFIYTSCRDVLNSIGTSRTDDPVPIDVEASIRKMVSDGFPSIFMPHFAKYLDGDKDLELDPPYEKCEECGNIHPITYGRSLVCIKCGGHYMMVEKETPGEKE